PTALLPRPASARAPRRPPALRPPRRARPPPAPPRRTDRRRAPPRAPPERRRSTTPPTRAAARSARRSNAGGRAPLARARAPGPARPRDLHRDARELQLGAMAAPLEATEAGRLLDELSTLGGLRVEHRLDAPLRDHGPEAAAEADVGEQLDEVDPADGRPVD